MSWRRGGILKGRERLISDGWRELELERVFTYIIINYYNYCSSHLLFYIQNSFIGVIFQASFLLLSFVAEDCDETIVHLKTFHETFFTEDAFRARLD